MDPRRRGLLAAGVSDELRRSEYAKRLDALVAEARKAGASAGGPLDRGDKLLRWLHDGPLAKGYASKQSSLAVVLDEGKFNCVSSAVLFNDLACRLGLDARAVEVPDHAFSIVYHDGRHADVETTTARRLQPGPRPPGGQGVSRKDRLRLPARPPPRQAARDQRRRAGRADLPQPQHRPARAEMARIVRSILPGGASTRS